MIIVSEKRIQQRFVTLKTVKTCSFQIIRSSFKNIVGNSLNELPVRVCRRFKTWVYLGERICDNFSLVCLALVEVLLFLMASFVFFVLHLLSLRQVLTMGQKLGILYNQQNL